MTREQILRMLTTDPKAVHKGIVRVFLNQTPDEKSAGRTIHSNGIGFNGRDDSYGSYLAQWVRGNKRLTGKFLNDARKMCVTYVGQLVAESEARLEANTVHLRHGSLNEMDPFGGAIWFTVERTG
jgi:hypothetical protein